MTAASVTLNLSEDAPVVTMLLPSPPFTNCVHATGLPGRVTITSHQAFTAEGYKVLFCALRHETLNLLLIISVTTLIRGQEGSNIQDWSKLTKLSLSCCSSP